MKTPAITKGIRFPVDLHNWVDKRAKDDERPFSWIVIKLLRERRDEEEVKSAGCTCEKSPSAPAELQFNLEPVLNDVNNNVEGHK